MSKQSTFLILLAAVLCIGILPARAQTFLNEDLGPYFQSMDQQAPAQDQAKGQWRLKFSVSPVVSTGGDDSAKFTEYRDVPDGAWSKLLAEYRSERYLVSFYAKNIGLHDQTYGLRDEDFGKYRLDFKYDQIPHRYAMDARSLFTGVGTGRLEIDDAIQADLQSSTDPVDADRRLQGYFAHASSFEEMTLRKKATVDFNLYSFQPWQIKLEFKREHKSGTRPFSGSFGFANFQELPMPIDYDTTEVRAGTEYASRSFYFAASYYASVFDNNISTLTWDNPFRITDSTAPTPVGFLSFNVGAATGRTDLFPSNDYQNVAFTASYRQLPWKGQLTGLFSWGFLHQNDPLLPFTTNTAMVAGAPNGVPFNASDPSTLPAGSVENKMNTPSLLVNYSSRPTRMLQLMAHYKYDALNNNSDSFTIPGFAALDNEWHPPITPTAVFTNIPISYDRNNLGVDAILAVWKRSQLSFGYTYDRMNRQNREVENLTENRYRVSFDSRPNEWFDFRASYERSNRNGSTYDFAQFYRSRGELFTPVLPWIRKYDEADRNRDDFQVLANFHPGQAWTVTGSVIVGRDKFPDSEFGLQKDNHTISTIEAAYNLAEKVDFNAYYSAERANYGQKDRSWIPFGPGDPYVLDTTPASDNNWTADTQDNSDTFGAGMHATLAAKLTFKFQLTYSKSNGQVDFATPIGPVDLNPYTPGSILELDDITRWVVMPELKYQAKDCLSVAFGYWYDSYDIKDYNVKGFMYIPTTPTGAFNAGLLMGTLPKDYQANVYYLTLTWKM